MKKIIALVLSIIFALVASSGVTIAADQYLCVLRLPCNEQGLLQVKPYDRPSREVKADPNGTIEFNCGNAVKLSTYGLGAKPSADWVDKPVVSAQYEDRPRLRELGYDINNLKKVDVLGLVFFDILRVSFDGSLWATAVADEADTRKLITLEFADGQIGYICEFTNTSYPTENPMCIVHPYGERWKTTGNTTSSTSTDTTPKPTTKPTAQPTAQPTATPTATPTPKPTNNGGGTGHSSGGYGDWVWNGSSWVQQTSTPTQKPTATPTPAPTNNGGGTDHSTGGYGDWVWNGTSWVRPGSQAGHS